MIMNKANYIEILDTTLRDGEQTPGVAFAPAEKLAIAKSNTALIIRQLMEANLVCREVDENDRRNFKLHITEQCRTLLPEIQKVIDECHRRITSTLSGREKVLLTQMLEQVRIKSEDL